MLISRYIFYCLSLLGLYANPTLAVENVPPSMGSSTIAVTLEPVKKVEKLAPEILDATFLYDVISTAEPIKFAVKSPIIENANTPNLKIISDISRASFGLTPEFTAIAASSSFAESMTFLHQMAATLKNDEKILLLSMAGEKLAQGYDESFPGGATPFDQLFANTQTGGKAGGVCRDIHSYLAEYAKALGFAKTGTFSFAVNADTRHQVSYFRDDVTNQYLVQDYTRIVNTGKTNLLEAIDVASSISGVYSQVVYLNSTRSGVHAYTPSPTRWISRHIKDVSSFDQKPIVILKTGKAEQTLQVSIATPAKEEVRAKGFFLHSDYTADEGVYRLDMFGVAGHFESNTHLMNSWCDEVGIVSDATIGHTMYENPLYLRRIPSQASGHKTLENDMVGFSVKGHTKIDQLTGSLLLEGESAENTGGSFISAYSHQIRPAFSYNILSSILFAEHARSFQILPNSMVEPSYGLKTVYDQFSIIVDSRTEKKASYLYFRGDYYVFDGLENMSAEGIKAMVKYAFPVGSVGEFALVLDASKIMKNRFNDPYFESLPCSEAAVQWMKDVSKNVELGSEVNIGNGRKPASYFEDSTKAIPTSGPQEPTFGGNVYIRFGF